MSVPETARARALALFDVLVDAPAPEREAGLAELRREDGAAADYLARLLDADAVPSRLLGRGAGALLAGGDDDATLAAAYVSGQAIGPYTLRERLGAGGMGEVWSAERSGEGFAQTVALKLLPPELGAGPAAARFRRERRILAALEHPSIARFIDGGVSREGVPFLAMERIDGAPITRHLDERRAALAERLTRFAEVCDVVAFAHRALVVHRDLKPSNVLVTTGGQVKLLDFGIAKLLEEAPTTASQEESAAAEATFRTRLDERVMTPAYAAPEQIRGEPVTTATDVWALGVLLYEVLTGERPFSAEDGGRVALERAVLESEPERPSARVARRGETTSGVGAGLARQLRGDLDAIVLTALEKDSARRAARDASRACQSATPTPIASPRTATAAPATATRWRRTNFAARYPTPARRAATGRPARKARRSSPSAATER